MTKIKRGRNCYVPKPVVDELKKIQETEGAKTMKEQWDRMTEYAKIGKGMKRFIALDMRKPEKRGRMFRK